MVSGDERVDIITQSIIGKLAEIETSNEVRIPLAVESGSRGWGFAAANADYDCRFIYVHKRDRYLSVSDMDEFIDFELNETFDIKGYDLKRVMRYIMKSQATINEWLSSNVVYICNGPIVQRLRDLAAEFFNPIPVSHHYLNLARKMFIEITSSDNAKIKKYFYILRPIANLNYIYRFRKMPDMEYDRTLAKISPPPDILTAINALKEQKMIMLEHDRIPAHGLLTDYFKAEIERFDCLLKDMKHDKKTDYTALDEAFRAIIEDLWI
jgi:predicted nucleotidyltransferase